eukprot:366449-Chlamydomonas_euryale.AAC.11
MAARRRPWDEAQCHWCDCLPGMLTLMLVVHLDKQFQFGKCMACASVGVKRESHVLHGLWFGSFINNATAGSSQGFKP